MFSIPLFMVLTEISVGALEMVATELQVTYVL